VRSLQHGRVEEQLGAGAIESRVSCGLSRRSVIRQLGGSREGNLGGSERHIHQLEKALVAAAIVYVDSSDPSDCCAVVEGTEVYYCVITGDGRVEGVG